MMHPATELRRVDPEIGLGVFATEKIPRGTVTWILCRFDLVFAPREVSALPPPYRAIIDRYAYVDADANSILCWDAGRYVNHSCDPPMLGVGRGFEIAIRDIEPGEQVTCDYGGLNLATPLSCRCGSPRCRETIDAEDVLHRWPELDHAIRVALDAARSVAQPLLAYSSDAERFWAWVDGRAALPSHRTYHAALAGARGPAAAIR